jgi:hypothetical protein
MALCKAHSWIEISSEKQRVESAACKLKELLQSSETWMLIIISALVILSGSANTQPIHRNLQIPRDAQTDRTETVGAYSE